jgi:hypothetical protein
MMCPPPARPPARAGKQIWANTHPMSCEELLVTQAKMVADAAARKGTGTRVFVYRNFVKVRTAATAVAAASEEPGGCGLADLRIAPTYPP